MRSAAGHHTAILAWGSRRAAGPLSLAAPHGLALALVSGWRHRSNSATTGSPDSHTRRQGPDSHTRRQGGSPPRQTPSASSAASRRRACDREPTLGAPPLPASTTGWARRSRARIATGDARATAAAQGASTRAGRARGRATAEGERVRDFDAASPVRPCADQAGLARFVAKSSPQRATPPNQMRCLANERQGGAHAWPTRQNAAGLAAVGPNA